MSDEEKKNDEKEPEVKETPEVAEAQPEVTPEEKPEEVETPETTEEAPAAQEATPEEVVELPYRDIEPGMVVRVHERILDASPKGDKRERIQIFEGMVIGMKSGGVSRTMTVRKDAKGWMVEKIYPLSSPNVTKVEVVKKHHVRRAKLSFLRGSKKRGKRKSRFKRKMKEIKE